jgi:hypothetical protein
LADWGVGEARAELADAGEVLELGELREAEHVGETGADGEVVVDAQGGAAGDVAGEDEGLLHLPRLRAGLGELEGGGGGGRRRLPRGPGDFGSREAKKRPPIGAIGLVLTCSCWPTLVLSITEGSIGDLNWKVSGVW